MRVQCPYCHQLSFEEKAQHHTENEKPTYTYTCRNDNCKLVGVTGSTQFHARLQNNPDLLLDYIEAVAKRKNPR